MFVKPADIVPASLSGLLDAAEQAVRAIPPAFPLEATVAVNPFLGQTDEDLATASVRLSRVAGVAVTRAREAYAADIASGRITDQDLADALAAEPRSEKPHDVAALKAAAAAPRPAPRALPTMAELAARDGVDWPALLEKTIGLWAAGHFDRGQALWAPKPGQGTYAAWRSYAGRDLTPEIGGLAGFCGHVAAAPDTPERAIARACERLGVTQDAARSVFHRLLMDLGGWSQHARWLLWQAELAGDTDSTLAELLAVRLVWEEALFAHDPGLEPEWREVVKAHEAPVEPGADEVIDAMLQSAAERAHQRRLIEVLRAAPAAENRPRLQAAFCIDVRSEVFRRALESQAGGIDTIGFAGFFGLPAAHTAHGSDVVENHLPVLLNPVLKSTSHAAPEAEHARRIDDRTTRAWGRFRQAAVSSFAFVEAAGLLYGWKLVKDALGLKGGKADKEPAPRFETDLSAEAKADTGAAVLKAMSLSAGHAPVVLLLGHAGNVTNNPHESAYHCGACGGYTGAVSARLLAALLNDPDTRAGLGSRGVDLPEDTVFVAGVHDTTTDDVTLFAEGEAGRADLAEIRGWLAGAGVLARAERALRLPGARPETLPRRARDWSAIRPEWGLAGCGAFIAAPRAVTSAADLGGRAFLHSYDWRADEGFTTLELIITAPVVVASWISLQYYGSSVAPDVFGGGDKLIHNVVGGVGVVEGNGGRLRPGLPWQAVHDGEALAHEPLRLTVMLEAPQDAVADILERHPGVQALFDNGWLHLLILENGEVTARYRPGRIFEPAARDTIAA
ncbi:MAG: YbcC family protein [Oceanicaulis sp.]